jgi:hypothetical protein
MSRLALDAMTETIAHGKYGLQTHRKSQYDRLLAITCDTEFPLTSNMDPLHILPADHHRAVQKDGLYQELRRIVGINAMRHKRGLDSIPPSSTYVMTGETGMEWAILDNPVYVAVILHDAQAFVVLFVPEYLD